MNMEKWEIKFYRYKEWLIAKPKYYHIVSSGDLCILAGCLPLDLTLDVEIEFNEWKKENEMDEISNFDDRCNVLNTNSYIYQALDWKTKKKWLITVIYVLMGQNWTR